MRFYPFRCWPKIGLLCLCLTLTIACGGGEKTFTRSKSTSGPVPESPHSLTFWGQTATPQRIILNLTTTPATSQAVTWRTVVPVAHPQAQIAPASGLSDFDKNARSVAADTETVTLDDGRMVAHHAVVFDALAPDTVYAYRVGATGAWSEWNQFTTASSKPAPFKFVTFGDPQEEVRSKCSRVFRAAYQHAPDADFWHFVGDLVDNGDRDAEWAELFDAFGWIPRTTPMIFLPGNHAYPNRRRVKPDAFRIFDLWRPHFTLPENGPAGLEETVYFLDYQGVRMVMLNGNEKLAEQALWLDRILSRNPQSWTIAAIHQPVYNTGKWRNRSTLQDLFVPIFDKYAVDLVLQGHDHTYSRTYKLRNGTRVGPDESGTVYVISVSGPKSYPVGPQHAALMEKSGTGRQLFQVIRVSQRHLEYEALDAAGTRYDAFVLKK
ncbi:phosphoesterase [Desulfosarcina ovata subsp. sediminis]|uniref:Phosphoesterase n=1 Tax=Desulfosarcina ovata subsp. sediminis TaxID=885957 RepID=A0A5K7ZU81_9BACT|nr:metallophosphoesterase family protein [Desulfosarcina ovata]BBO83711.1 phosphoesterase [Desulfosarcina ovata subsp. sediminis]